MLSRKRRKSLLKRKRHRNRLSNVKVSNVWCWITITSPGFSLRPLDSLHEKPSPQQRAWLKLRLPGTRKGPRRTSTAHEPHELGVRGAPGTGWLADFFSECVAKGFWGLDLCSCRVTSSSPRRRVVNFSTSAHSKRLSDVA